MNVKRMLAVGTILLITAGLWAQDEAKKPAAKSGHKAAMKSGGDVEQTLKDLENKWVEASKKGDTAAMNSILADGFVSMGTDGKYTTKQEYVTNIGKGKWETNEISNVQVHAHGNHAVVTGDWRGKGTDGTGKQVDTTEHWIDTFVKMPNGTWQAIASGATKAQ